MAVIGTIKFEFIELLLGGKPHLFGIYSYMNLNILLQKWRIDMKHKKIISLLISVVVVAGCAKAERP